MLVILGLRTKSFRTFIKRFSTIFKTAVYVSTDQFCGKKFFFHQYLILRQIFLTLFHKSARRFSKLHLACSGEKFEIISFVLENKIFFVFIWFFFPEIYRKTSWNCILSVQRIFFRGKGCLKHHKIVYVFATWSESFLDLRQTFFDKNVKTAFYVSKQTYCRKMFIHQFQKLRELFRDFGQETRLTLSSSQNCTQRV